MIELHGWDVPVSDRFDWYFQHINGLGRPIFFVYMFRQDSRQGKVLT